MYIELERRSLVVFLAFSAGSGGGEKSGARKAHLLSSISSSSSGWSGSVFLIRKKDVSYVTGPA